ncbi:DUF2065 family protein [Salmonella enterica subsp. enterica serovar 6,8:-:1,2]|nr:DUF2065 family protein [Salmonella enterica subsp. enterica serovar 6,8:-:1,2]
MLHSTYLERCFRLSPWITTNSVRSRLITVILNKSPLLTALAQLPENVLRRFGGGLVVAGVVVYYMLRKTIG